MTEKIWITPLGGVGEIGSLNCMLYETATEAFLIDSGSMFPDEEILGVDLIIPDFSSLESIRHKLKGIIFTHGHEDHIGSSPFLLRQFNIPVYATPFTAGLIREKCEEYALPKKPRINVFKPGDTVKLGSFEIQTAFVNHSILDACALAIQTDQGSIIHLTDWKIDYTPPSGLSTDLKTFKRWGKEGVLALFSDSTNVNISGATLSEKEVLKQIKKIVKKHQGRIIVTLFASNVQRVQGLLEIAKETGRVVSLLGRSMKENTKLANQLGSLSFAGVDVVDVEETRGLDPSRVMLLVTGTQGEPRSVLTRLAHNNFKPFQIAEGDLVLYSARVIPGNERNIYHNIDQLSRHGAKVLYEAIHDIHTSGHAHQDELETAVKKLRPRHFIPIHGAYRQLLQHAQLVKEWGVKKENIFVVENGQTLLFDNKKGAREGGLQVGRVFVDGSGIGDIDTVVLRDRRQLAGTGIVICVLMIDRVKGEILRGPELISRGFIEAEDGQEIFERAKKIVTELLESFNFEERKDLAEVQEEVRVALRRFFNKELDRKPVVIPVIQEV